jgi:hypothetical protein
MIYCNASREQRTQDISWRAGSEVGKQASRQAGGPAVLPFVHGVEQRALGITTIDMCKYRAPCGQ